MATSPSPSSSTPAVLFDIDGTLIDTNYFHTLAWWRALRDAGEDVPMSRIHPLIGMGSDHLLESLLGEQREGLSDGHSEHFSPFKSEIRAFPGAGDLLRAVADRGAKVVIVTSAKKDDLKEMLAAVDADDAITEIVDGDDTERSKPSPDIIAVAMEKVDLDPRRTIMLGDTVWDIEAAAKVDVKCAGVLTGGTTRHALAEAGAVAVYEDVAEVLRRLDDDENWTALLGDGAKAKTSGEG